MLKGDVQALEVLADENDIDVFVASARYHRADWPQVGIQPKGFPQANVHRPEAAPHGRGERALEGKLGALDALEERSGKGIALIFNCGDAALLLIPLERRAEGIEDVNDSIGDFWADSVAWDQSCRNTGELLLSHGVGPLGGIRIGKHQRPLCPHSALV